MKQNFKLTKDQQTLVEKNLSIVHWVIVNNIHVNPGICGLEYGDLFQEGCLWLCKAAFTYHAGQAQLSNHPVRRSGVHGRYAGNGDLEHAQLENPALG